jgi:hypothetical protein
MPDLINTRLLAHPANWLIVWTVTAFAVLAYTLVHERIHSLPPIDQA